jgi:hypothetical protein
VHVQQRQRTVHLHIAPDAKGICAVGMSAAAPAEHMRDRLCLYNHMEG